MKKEKEEVNLELKNEVLRIIDVLYKVFIGLDRGSNNIALQIMESISLSYAMMNCDLYITIDKTLIPYLKKMTENERLEEVKGLLTNGYIDIKGTRFHMRHLPFLNDK